ncbi:unnamed protein product [Periconia digitata]|uniref:Nuclear pore complex protein n=1 Tax=Periconia digitata TaxID=1303443 RepID=A0A9W4U648_9PLEO|nr:unnamed protein product [Periconia digitata]
MDSLFAPRRSASNFRSQFLGASRTPASHAHTNDPLQPLRTMADRVGKEVEKFAERVDHWHIHGNEDAKTSHQTTVKMVGKFRDLAKSTVDELKKQHDSEHRGELDKSVRRRIHNMAPNADVGNADLAGRFSQSIVSSVEPGATPATSSMQELRQWQAELATWELVHVIIDHYHPEPGTDVAAQKASRLAQVGGDHSYSPKEEIWNRYIIADDAAREKKVILKWLQETARNTESDIDTIVTQWGQLSGKDTKTWTSGWLDTKAKIKQAKRMQGSDKPLPEDYHLASSSGHRPLVTRLDPDAPIKQNRALEESDEYYENALWMVCYEMLRRGDSWEKISDWCKERNEAWRGVSLGVAHDFQPDGGPNMSGNDLGFFFRRVCVYAARGARIPYEGAVYALLGGDVSKIHAACRSWDDHLYAHYNALLLARFDGFVHSDPSRVNPDGARNFVFVDETTNYTNWDTTNKAVIEKLLENAATSSQAKAPMKLIQGALISQNLDNLMYKAGVAVADLQQNDERLNTLMLDPDSDWDHPEPKMATDQRRVVAGAHYQALVKDPHALRILVHIFIALYGGLGVIEIDSNAKLYAMNNVLTYYIEFLRVTKRLQLIPLYAAQLGEYRSAHCMARVLPDIKNNEEQKRCMDLMNQYRIKHLEVVNESFVLQLKATGYVDERSYTTVNPIQRFMFLEQWTKQDAFLWPGVRIKGDISGLEISSQDEAVIESLMWYNHIEKDFECTFRDLYTALETFLLNGRIGAAEKLATEMSVEAISLTKTLAVCGYAFDFTAPEAEEQDEQQAMEMMNTSLRSSGNGSIRPSGIPNKQEHKRHVLELRTASEKYGNLCQLVRVITLLREWRVEEENLIQQRGTDAKISTKNIKQLSATIESSFEDVFNPKFDPTDNVEIWKLYKAYVPELTIAFLTVVQSGAFFIHRDTATKAMDVATIVADSDKEWLQKVFLETGRMKDLVTVLANVSKAMLKLGEHADGKTMAKKRDSKGQTLRIWDLTARN